jgi:hypothetical protein
MRTDEIIPYERNAQRNDNGAADVKHYANSVTERMRNGRQRRKERQWQDG